MKLIKKNSKILITFVLGIIFGSIGVYAGALMNSNEVNFTPKNNKWNVTKVDEALNSLYSVAVPEEYSGTTEITPTYSDITLNTQDKLLKNNIIISGIPSTYKNLTNTTTGTSADLATGKTLYNSDGSLITGTAIVGSNCVVGSVMLTSDCTTTSGCILFEGFNPTKFVINVPNFNNSISYYDANLNSTSYTYYNTKTKDTYLFSTFLKYEDNKLIAHNWGNPFVSNEAYYIMCK